jgi:hypothetical protein
MKFLFQNKATILKQSVSHASSDFATQFLAIDGISLAVSLSLWVGLEGGWKEWIRFWAFWPFLGYYGSLLVFCINREKSVARRFIENSKKTK